MRSPIAFAALVLASACGDGSGSGDAAAEEPVDTAAEDTFDPCLHYPGSCNLDGRNPHAPYDCCPTGTECCPMCHDDSRCGLAYECLASCPETLPCTGSTGGGGFSCYYDPGDITGTVYCPVPEGSLPNSAVPCTSECAAGTICPFPADPWGDAALCCPAGTSCATSGFDLPFCS